MSVNNYTPIAELVKEYNRQLKLSSSRVGKPKEAEPFPRKKDWYEVKEITEHEPEKDLETFVMPRAETIKLPPDLKKMGVQTVKTTNFPAYESLKLPMSDEKIVAGRKEPITSSLRWLITFYEFLLAQAHLALKVIHGKVVRVIKT